MAAKPLRSGVGPHGHKGMFDAEREDDNDEERAANRARIAAEGELDVVRDREQTVMCEQLVKGVGQGVWPVKERHLKKAVEITDRLMGAKDSRAANRAVANLLLMVGQNFKIDEASKANQPGAQQITNVQINQYVTSLRGLAPDKLAELEAQLDAALIAANGAKETK